MTTKGADVRSIDAIESFRTSLLVFLSKARPLLDDACDDVVRTRQWLQNDRRIHWEHQARRRAQKLEQAEQALFSARFANLRGPPSAELIAVERARRSLAEAEEKLKAVKRWARDFEHHAQPLVKQLEQLRAILAGDMAKGAAYLAEVVKVLDIYASTSPVSIPGSTSSVEPDHGGAPSSDAQLKPGAEQPQDAAASGEES